MDRDLTVFIYIPCFKLLLLYLQVLFTYTDRLGYSPSHHVLSTNYQKKTKQLSEKGIKNFKLNRVNTALDLKIKIKFFIFDVTTLTSCIRVCALIDQMDHGAWYI